MYWHYRKGMVYYRPIFRLTKLAFLRARAIQREDIFYLLRGSLHSNSFS